MLHAARDTAGTRERSFERMDRGDMPHLTPNQRKVFAVLADLDRSAGAYELLDLLRSEGVNAIPTIYRALNQLEAKGLVRHLASTKSFVALNNDLAPRQQRVMLVCDRCRTVTPINDTGIVSALKANAEREGFAVRSKHLELVGTCSSCLAKEQSS
jgi:Fur family zinc uptake transcriptional regulator